MKYILCYGDSNTWGASPDQLPRFGFETRWPGVLQNALGGQAHIYENGLCGRTSGFTDDVEPGRNGRMGFPNVLETSAPLDLVIIMLGANDCKRRFSNHPAWDSALNVQNLARAAQSPLYGPDGIAPPQVLLIAPAGMGTDWEHSWVGEEFDLNSNRKAASMPGLFEKIACQEKVGFLRASDHAGPGADCVHLTAASHAALGEAVAEKVREMLELTGSGKEPRP